jgi:3-hydroxybutyryl-CoA dehydrogenase
MTVPDPHDRSTPAVVGVVGAGTMGTGIAQVALEHGHEVWLHDVAEEAVVRGRVRIRDGLLRRAAKAVPPEDVDRWVDERTARLHAAAEAEELAARADVVIEAALEHLEVKRALFRRLDASARPGAILATNTSALRVAAIAEAAGRPERVLGLHFFNPAPVMALVEVVATPFTDPAAIDRAAGLVERWDKVAVRSADMPGFIVNRVNRPFTLEALAALERGEAGVAEIDAALRAAGFPMGPFALMDLIGIDVNLAAASGVHAGFVERGDATAGRLRPSPIQERLVAVRRLGRKTGRGFYHYGEDGRSTGPDPAFAGPAPADGPATAAATIAERVRLAIDAEAWRARGDGVATVADIDRALRLGAAHPSGPFEHTEAIGGPAELARRLADLEAAGLGPRFSVPPSLLGED